MTVRSLVKACTPPIVVSAARRIARRVRPQASATRPEWEYVSATWSRGLPASEGWNVCSVVETQLAKWDQFVTLTRGASPLGVYHEASTLASDSHVAHNIIMSFAYVVGMAAQGRHEISLLDWGGGIGHYAVLAKALFPGLRVEYHCKDLPLLCRAGRTVLPDATFYDDGDVALSRQYDLVMASGSLQYDEDWEGRLRALASASRAYVYVARLPVIEAHPSFVVVQRPHECGYQTEYVGWFLNRSAFLDAAAGAGLTLLREFLIEEQPMTLGAPEQCRYRGFLFKVDAAAQTPGS